MTSKTQVWRGVFSESTGSQGDRMKFRYKMGDQPLSGYTIQRGVGVGGFGDVYFAYNDAGKEVALKQIQRNLEVEVRGVRQCLNLKHPNLISLYDIRFDDDGQGWIVMEYVAGPSLRETIDRHPSGLTIDDALSRFAHIAAAVAYLHDQGIVHRDLKPGNIFDDNGVCKIGDYGLSKFINYSGRIGHTESVGTFHYMAPEIAKGEYGREIDIYALGIILYEMLSGNVPYDGESTHEIIMKHLTASPDLSVLPASVRPVISRALQKDPKQRFADVRQMAGLLNIMIDERCQIDYRAAAEVVTASVVDRIEPAYASQETRAIQSPQQPKLEYDQSKLFQEPVARSLQWAWLSTWHWWNGLQLTPSARAAAITGIVVTSVVLFGQIVGLLVLGLMFYVPYYVIWLMIGSKPERDQGRPVAYSGGPTPSTHAQPIVPATRQAAYAHDAYSPPNRPLSATEAKKLARQRLAQSTNSHWMADVSQSWLIAIGIHGVLFAIAMLLQFDRQSHSTEMTAATVWLGTMSLLCTASVLFFGRLWQAREGSDLLRRFMLFPVGCLIGLAGAGLEHFLLLGHTNSAFFVALFGLMFGLIGWWKQADPLRRRRVRISSLIWSGLGVFLIATLTHNQLNRFAPMNYATIDQAPPQISWMVALAVIASLAIQMSSPWIAPEDRLATMSPSTRPDENHGLV